MPGKVIQFSDMRAAKRSQLRLQNAKDNQRQYAAAKVTRTTGDWMPVNRSINDITRTSLPAMRTRIRQMVRDFPYFARAVNILVDFTVGTGTNFQSRVLNPRLSP
jgi:capsid protein